MTTETATPQTPHELAKDATGREPVRPLLSFYIYDAPVRLWHWATALLVLALCLTGYFIASPPQSVAGDTSELWTLGRLREWHFMAAWLLTIGLLWRGYWAVVGGKHARLIYFVPFWSGAWWKELWSVVRWYLFLDLKTHRWVGHNPLARGSMFLMFTVASTFMVFSGMALYGEQKGYDSWESTLFGWMISLFGSSMTLRSWHHITMYVLVLFSIAHIYAAFRDDIMGRVSTISSMISGWRTFRDTKD